MTSEILSHLALITSALGFILTGIGLLYNARQLRLSRRVAKAEFILGFDENLVRFSEIERRLRYEEEEYGAKEAFAPDEKYMLFRYERRLGTLRVLIEDGILEEDLVDRVYSNRIVPIAMNPEVRLSHLPEHQAGRSEFDGLVRLLEHKPIYQNIAEAYEKRRQREKPAS